VQFEATFRPADRAPSII